MQTKKSSYRQSGWKELSTGIIFEFFGTDMPVQDGTFVKIWDNLVTETTTVTPVDLPKDELPTV